MKADSFKAPGLMQVALWCVLTSFMVKAMAVEETRPIYFLVGPSPLASSNLVEEASFVIPLVTNEQINVARKLIARWESGRPPETNEASAPTVTIRTIHGADQINRDYHGSKLSPWTWHAVECLGFGNYNEGLLLGRPTPNTVEKNRGMVETEWGLANIFAIPNYTILGELGPEPFRLTTWQEADTLQFTWTTRGSVTNELYTLEVSDRIDFPEWSSFPGVSWPTSDTSWITQQKKFPRYYRVRAEPRETVGLSSPAPAESKRSQ